MIARGAIGQYVLGQSLVGLGAEASSSRGRDLQVLGQRLVGLRAEFRGLGAEDSRSRDRGWQV